MARGDNFPKGPYSDIPTRKGEGVIGAYRCDCGTVLRVKVNKSGWPYTRCADKSCGDRRTVQGKMAAARIIASITHWHEQARAPAIAIARKSLPALFRPMTLNAKETPETKPKKSEKKNVRFKLIDLTDTAD